MPFFSNLADRISGYTLQLTVTKGYDGKLTVMLYPQVSDKSQVQEKISPLSITGTPQELDQGFFASLGATLDKTKEFAAVYNSDSGNISVEFSQTTRSCHHTSPCYVMADGSGPCGNLDTPGNSVVAYDLPREFYKE